MPIDLADSGSLLIFAVVFFTVIAVGAAFLKGEKPKRKNRSKWRGRPDLKVVPKRGEDEALATASEQLRKVMAAEFNSRPLLNRPEAQVFEALDKAVIARNPGWQVMAQVSLGEFLASPDKDAFLAVNSKRVDFALMDDQCRVVHALEYQGSGHHTRHLCRRARRSEEGGACARPASVITKLWQVTRRRANCGFWWRSWW